MPMWWKEILHLKSSALSYTW